MRNHWSSTTSLTPNRRQFLSRLVLAALPLPARLRAAGADQSADLGIQGPDFSSVRTPITPNNQFFIRNNFSVPLLNPESWKLRVTGAVRHPLELDYREITNQPNRSLMVTLECAGNPVGGGGVSTATWTGTALRELLDRAGIEPGVKFVRFVGGDQGSVNGFSESPVSFMRSIPLDKALNWDTLLAHQMNGGVLPAEHGYPLRAIVPGWYGMDSVKWLTQIEALDRE